MLVALASDRGVEPIDLVRTVLNCQLWVPYTLVAYAAARRFPVAAGRALRHAPIHIACAAFAVVTRPLVVRLANPWLGWLDPVPTLGTHLLSSVRYNLVLYLLIAIAAHSIYFAVCARDREREAAQLSAQLASARLATLRGQLRPHFLFNALTGIAELVHRDADAADRMLVRLAELLRRTLRDCDIDEVTLAEELRTLEAYVELERMRYGSRLAVTIDVEPSALATRVPALLLQPLVENAIRHGIGARLARGTVSIRASSSAQAVCLEVEDDGAGLAADHTWGIGLANTRARLEALYGSLASMRLSEVAGSGTRVTIMIPRVETGP
jgi:signal transduction histidine kinase